MNIITNRALNFYIMLVGLPMTWQSACADGTDIIAPKRSVSGTISDPPAADDGEYADSGVVQFDNDKGSFRVRTYREAHGVAEEIQFYFSINDGTVGLGDAGDQIQVRFDLDHSNSSTEFDKGFRVLRSLKEGETNHVRITNIVWFGDPQDGADIPESQWSLAPDLNSTWTVEVKLNASDLGLNYIPSMVGMHIFVNDSDGDPGNYPFGVNKSEISRWSNLKTRKNLEYVLLLDRSGSMTSSIDGGAVNWERWDAAKTASDIFVQLFYAARSDADRRYFNDKIGLATYTAEEFPRTDLSKEVKNLESLNTIAVDGYVDSDPAPDPPYDMTPIKYGLNKAFSMYSTNDAERVVLLLSDGIHNFPMMNYDEEDYNYGNFSHDDFQVNTVALSSEETLDSEVGTALLNRISENFDGFASSYLDATSRPSLVDAFAGNLFGHLYLNKTDINNGTFRVNADEPRIIVMLVWHTVENNVRGFRLRRPDGSIIGINDSTYHHYRNTDLGYELAYYVVNTPADGNWRTINLNNEGSVTAENNLAIFDPTVYAYFTATKSGKDFILKAVVKEYGVPMSESDSDVTVTISKPDQGLGSYASLAHTNCIFKKPELPSIDKIREILQSQRQYRFVDKRVPVGTPTTIGNEANEREDVPGYVKFVRKIFTQCNSNGQGLARSDGIVLKLYDDESHGDQTAGDGVFTRRYTDTAIEGTYKFNFKAKGTSPSGSAYSRVKRLSAYNKIEPGSKASIFEFRDIGYIKGRLYREYYLVPKSDAGEYLGPGHLNQIGFVVEGGEAVGKIQDYQNGIYSQLVAYAKDGDKPTVAAVVNDKQIAKSDSKDKSGWRWYYWLIALLLLFG